MAQSKLLVDSNSYFRLAQNIHPLLSTPFGKEQYTLYPHEDLTFELARSPRLKTKFHWFMEAGYVENRKRKLQLGKKDRAAIQDNFDHIWGYIQDQQLNPLEVDTRILAAALQLEIPVITDDRDMREVADIFEISCISSMELMKMMLDANHIDIERIRQVAAQWRYENEWPYGGWEKEYSKLFGEKPPKE